MIVEQKTFTDGANLIQGRYPVDGSAPTFFAVAWMEFAMPTGNVRTTFQFDIPGATPEEAFTNFPAVFEAAKVKADVDFRKQMATQQLEQASRIIVPGQESAPRINGRIH